MTKRIYYAQYKCPVCNYETNVTNICRHCLRSMYPTGKECSWNRKKEMDDVRELQKDNPEYPFAMQWASISLAGDKLEKREVPEWAIKIMKEFFKMDLSFWEKRDD